MSSQTSFIKEFSIAMRTRESHFVVILFSVFFDKKEKDQLIAGKFRVFVINF